MDVTASISAHVRLSPKNGTMQSPNEKSTNVGTQNSSGTVNLNQNVLLLIEQIKVKITPAITFWDSRSTISLVCTDFVKRSKVVGVPILYDLTTVGGSVTTHYSTLYEITISDRKKRMHKLKIHEIYDICGKMGSTNIDSAVHLFPSMKIEEVRRTSGKIEMLIGMEYAQGRR